MKKILLIEDREERQRLFSNETKIDLDIYSDILDNAIYERYNEVLAELKNNTFNFDQYDVIITHKSAFGEDNQIILSRIQTYCKKNNKILILFSGGIVANYYDNSEYELMEINSKDFYSENLKMFLEGNNYENILILSYGKEWKLNILLNVFEKINYFLGEHSEEDILFDTFSNEVNLQLLHKLKVPYYQPNIENGWVYRVDLEKIYLSIDEEIKKKVLYEK